MCDNLLLLLFIWDISWRATESYCFQGVRPTRNIMYEVLFRDGIGGKWIDLHIPYVVVVGFFD